MHIPEFSSDDPYDHESIHPEQSEQPPAGNGNAFDSSGIVPTEASDLPPDAPVEAQLPIGPQQIEQTHFIGDRVIRGDHPDPGFRRAVAQLRLRETVDDLVFHHHMSTVPTRNDEFGDEVAMVQRKLAADFGLAPSAAPLAVLDRQQFDQVIAANGADVHPEARGGVLSHHLIVLVDPAEDALFDQRRLVVNSGLHEGAHQSAPARLVIWSNQMESPAGNYFDPDFTYATGFEEIDCSQPGVPERLNHFWEEGFCEGYTVDNMVNLGMAIDPGEPYEPELGEAAPLRYVSHNSNQSHIDAETGRLCLPWDYVPDIALPAEGEPLIRISMPGIAAYGVDLLNERLPGLSEDMVASRQDPALKDRIRQRINSLRPGLYEAQGRLPYTYQGFATGLARVIRVLNLEGSPVRRLH